MKSNSGKYITFVLMAVIAIPTLSNVVAPLAFASIQQSDMVQIGTDPPVIIPETEEPSGLIPLGLIPSQHPPLLIELAEPVKEGGGFSDILFFDPDHTVCPQIPGGPASNSCFMSDNEKQDTILDNIGKWQFGVIEVPETGEPQDLSIYFGDLPPGSLIVQSDVEPNPTIPEFPIPFSLVIIFVAVAAVYMGIRQKMIPGFKSF